MKSVTLLSSLTVATEARGEVTYLEKNLCHTAFGVDWFSTGYSVLSTVERCSR